MGVLWWQFGLSAVVVVVAGVALAQCADVIAEKGRLGGVLVGTILLAGATSLPEVVTSISAGLLELPDIAVGNVFGSNIFNVFIIAIADLFDGRGSILRKASPGHILAALFGIILSGMAAVGILAPLGYHVAGVGIDTIAIFAVYLFGVRMLGRYDRREPGRQAMLEIDPAPARMQQRLQMRQKKRQQKRTETMSLPVAYVVFGLASAAIVLAGVNLSRTGDALAEATGLGATFVGSILIAAVTSLPEVVTTMSAVLAGSFDLAVGNVLGSNIFNMLILLMADISYRPGPILAAVQHSHVVVALMGAIMSAIVVTGLFYRSRRSYGRLGPDSLAIVGTYVLALLLLYALR